MTDTQDQPQPVAAAASTASPPAPPKAALGFAVLALFVASANLRPAIAAVSPLVNQIQTSLGLSSIGVSLLTAIPTLAMGLCAPLAASVGRRLGLHAGVLIGLAVIAVGSLARGAAAATWLQLSCAAVVGGGIAIAQTLLPAIVKTRFASRASLVTGLYTAGLGLGGGGERECPFLDGDVGVDVGVGGPDASVAEPEGDHGGVDAGLQQRHGLAVALMWHST